MRRRRLGALAAAILGGLALLLLLSPIDPAPYRAPQRPPLSGPLTANHALRRAELILEGRLHGPEDVDVDAGGRLYCGLADGTVVRSGASQGPMRLEVVADTGGRPLGLDFDTAGVLWIADSRQGLLSLDPAGNLGTRATTAGGLPIRFANDVAAGSDGKVYFSDASSRFGPDELLREALEARPHGRLLEHDPGRGRTRVLLDGLFFANGVAVSPDGRFVLVAETFRYRIRRLWLTGSQAGRDEVLIADLPGFPDGVSATRRGTFWLALYALRSDWLDRRLHPRPWLKRLVAWLPGALQPGADPYGLVVEIDAAGRALRSFHDPGGRRIRFVTSVEEVSGQLYLGSVGGRSIARYRLP